MCLLRFYRVLRGLDAVWSRRVKMVTLVCPVCLFAESSFSDNAMISSKVCPFYIEKAMHRIFTLIPYLQSYNTLPFYLADLGIA